MNGDRSTGKTTIAIDTIINQAKINKQGEKSGDENFRPVYCIYVAVGQKNANVARTIKTLEDSGAMEYVTIVSAPAADNPANQYLAPYGSIDLLVSDNCAVNLCNCVAFWLFWGT